MPSLRQAFEETFENAKWRKVDAYVNSILHCVLTISATWAWADAGGGHHLADKNLQADVFNGGGVPPFFAFFGDFMIIEVSYRL